MVCRIYQPGDEDGILHLYRRVFGIEIALPLWQWFYERPPAGMAVIVVLERADEQAWVHDLWRLLLRIRRATQHAQSNKRKQTRHALSGRANGD